MESPPVSLDPMIHHLAQQRDTHILPTSTAPASPSPPTPCPNFTTSSFTLRSRKNNDQGEPPLNSARIGPALFKAGNFPGDVTANPHTVQNPAAGRGINTIVSKFPHGLEPVFNLESTEASSHQPISSQRPVREHLVNVSAEAECPSIEPDMRYVEEEPPLELGLIAEEGGKVTQASPNPLPSTPSFEKTNEDLSEDALPAELGDSDPNSLVSNYKMIPSSSSSSRYTQKKDLISMVSATSLSFFVSSDSSIRNFVGSLYRVLKLGTSDDTLPSDGGISTGQPPSSAGFQDRPESARLRQSFQVPNIVTERYTDLPAHERRLVIKIITDAYKQHFYPNAPYSSQQTEDSSLGNRRKRGSSGTKQKGGSTRDRRNGSTSSDILIFNRFAHAIKAGLDSSLTPEWHVICGHRMGYAVKYKKKSLGLFRLNLTYPEEGEIKGGEEKALLGAALPRNGNQGLVVTSNNLTGRRSRNEQAQRNKLQSTLGEPMKKVSSPFSSRGSGGMQSATGSDSMLDEAGLSGNTSATQVMKKPPPLRELTAISRPAYSPYIIIVYKSPEFETVSPQIIDFCQSDIIVSNTSMYDIETESIDNSTVGGVLSSIDEDLADSSYQGLEGGSYDAYINKGTSESRRSSRAQEVFPESTQKKADIEESSKLDFVNNLNNNQNGDGCFFNDADDSSREDWIPEGECDRDRNEDFFCAPLNHVEASASAVKGAERSRVEGGITSSNDALGDGVEASTGKRLANTTERQKYSGSVAKRERFHVISLKPQLKQSDKSRQTMSIVKRCFMEYSVDDLQEFAQIVRKKLTGHVGPVWHVVIGSKFAVARATSSSGQGLSSSILSSTSTDRQQVVKNSSTTNEAAFVELFAKAGKHKIICYQHSQAEAARWDSSWLMKRFPIIIMVLVFLLLLLRNRLCSSVPGGEDEGGVQSFGVLHRLGSAKSVCDWFCVNKGFDLTISLLAVPLITTVVMKLFQLKHSRN